MSIPHLNGPADLETVNQTLCGNLSLLFTLLLAGLTQAISRSGGKLLANEFEQRMNHYAEQHGWRALTGLTDLTDLRGCVPEVNAKMLSTVYASYGQYARTLAGQILGEQLLTTTIGALLSDLPPRLIELNAQYNIVRID
jgi:hypothetical protein